MESQFQRDANFQVYEEYSPEIEYSLEKINSSPGSMYSKFMLVIFLLRLTCFFQIGHSLPVTTKCTGPGACAARN